MGAGVSEKLVGANAQRSRSNRDGLESVRGKLDRLDDRVTSLEYLHYLYAALLSLPAAEAAGVPTSALWKMLTAIL